MPGPLAAAVGVGLGSSLINGISANNAADAQSDASAAQLQLHADMFNRQDEVSGRMYRQQGRTIDENALANRGYSDDAERRSINQSKRLYGDVKGRAVNALRKGTHEIREARGKSIDGFRPAMRLGENALRAYASNLGVGRAPEGYELSMTPGSQFLMGKMNEGVQGSAAASGGLYSGATMEALQKEAAGIASLDRDNQQGQLFGLAGMGQNAAGNVANLRMGAAGGINALRSQFTDRMAGYGADRANGITNAIDTNAARQIGIGDTAMTNLGAARSMRANLMGSAAQGYAAGGANALYNRGQAGAASANGWGDAIAGGLNSGFGMYKYMGGQFPGMGGGMPMSPSMPFGTGGQGPLY
jgi:hypothetical protein